MLRRAEKRASYEKPGRTTKSWPRACEAAATATEPWWRHPQHWALVKQQGRAATFEATAAPMYACVAHRTRVAPARDASGGGRGAGAAHRGHDARAQRRGHAHAAQQRAGQATRVLHDCLRREARARERRRSHKSAVPHRARAPDWPPEARRGQHRRPPHANALGDAVRTGSRVAARGPHARNSAWPGALSAGHWSGSGTAARLVAEVTRAGSRHRSHAWLRLRRSARLRGPAGDGWEPRSSRDETVRLTAARCAGTTCRRDAAARGALKRRNAARGLHGKRAARCDKRRRHHLQHCHAPDARSAARPTPHSLAPSVVLMAATARPLIGLFVAYTCSSRRALLDAPGLYRRLAHPCRPPQLVNAFPPV